MTDNVSVILSDITGEIYAFQNTLQNDRSCKVLVSTLGGAVEVNSCQRLESGLILFTGIMDGNTVEVIIHPSQINLSILAEPNDPAISEPKRIIGFGPPI